jgi:hypothetical protein
MSEREQRLLKLLSRLMTALVLMQLSIERGNAHSLLALHLTSALRFLKTECPTLLTWVEMIYRDENPPYELCQIGEIEATEGLKARL